MSANQALWRAQACKSCKRPPRKRKPGTLKIRKKQRTKMPIQQKTPQSQVDGYLEKRIAMIERAIIREFLIIGEKMLNISRDTTKPHTFKDQTGNLRSSMGYAVSVDGNLLKQSDFAVVKDGGAGRDEGIAFSKEVAVNLSDNGIVLTFVAGMNYAYYVKKNGYDVLDSAMLYGSDAVKQLINNLKLKVG